MTTIFVQFTDESDTVIQNSFASSQDGTGTPNLGTVESSDPRWKTFYDMFPVWSRAGLVAPD